VTESGGAIDRIESAGDAGGAALGASAFAASLLSR
jgi:hypothetical protein